MRYYFMFFLLSISLVAAAGCAPRGAAEPAATAPLSALAAPDAVATGRHILEEGGFTWVGSPQPMLAQRMTYSEAAQRIPAMSSDAQYSEYWPDTLVWLVILKGEWDLMPMGPLGATLVPNRYQGCLMVLFTDSDPRVIAAGDTLCPGQ